jgi:hypothetical protein
LQAALEKRRMPDHNVFVFVAWEHRQIAPIVRAGARYLVPLFLSNLAMAYAELGRYDEASRCIDEVIITLETTKGRWFEAEASRVAGEITLRLPMADAAKAQAYFERALAPMLTLSELPASAGPYFFETFVDREGARLAPCSLISSVRTHNS